jgi:2,4-dienoyl-CoA reductase-like NADH-dependent reductase (Old Yellow Enzyme family)
MPPHSAKGSEGALDRLPASIGDSDPNAGVLFQPLRLGALALKNRVVMAPMTRSCAPGGIPRADVAAYYRRRAEGGVGLIITEGTWVPEPNASFDDRVPRFYGEDALAGWARVVAEVHGAGALIFPQLWHVGQQLIEGRAADGTDRFTRVGPSGFICGNGVAPRKLGEPASLATIEAAVEAYGTAAENAVRLGCDGVEIHAAHGYLIDQFFWGVTNRRADRYGGGVRERARFGAEIIAEIRRRVSPEFPISLRISQFKLSDYNARLVGSPGELAQLLEPLVDAGVSLIHCSQRRFWEGEFGSDLNLAGWVKKLTGLPTITAGSVTLQSDIFATLRGESSSTSGISELIDKIERGDFDLVAIGRALIANPEWVRIVRSGALDALKPFSPTLLAALN